MKVIDYTFENVLNFKLNVPLITERSHPSSCNFRFNKIDTKFCKISVEDHNYAYFQKIPKIISLLKINFFM